MKRTVFNLTTSALVVGLTMVACAAQSDAMRRRGPFVKANARTDVQAADHHEQAIRAIHQGQLAQALARMEQAVALSPRDAGYRLLLADIYMKSGRFDSARATFADVLELDPGHVRAGLGFALMQIALGRPQAAVPQLEALERRASSADVGLAFALAGLPERAIAILEPAARSFDATPRLRQNLALSLALAGDWARARAIASQDISPADLGPRMVQWAALAHPDAAPTRVAALIGVNPVSDPGQPVRLALAPAATPAAVATAPQAVVAEAERSQSTENPASISVNVAAAIPLLPPVAAPAAPAAPLGPVPVEAAAAIPTLPATSAPTAPVASAEARSHYLPTPAPAPQRTEEENRYAAAARTLITPNPVVVRSAAVALPPAPLLRRQPPAIRSGNSRFVVQLGAYDSEGVAENGWRRLQRRFGFDGRVPLTMAFSHGGRTFHRVAIGSFASQADAIQMCRSIKARGGACFVRTNAGDASVRWAARYARSRAGNA